ncbi:MAG: hypothetical protein AAF662_14130 [Pseudomonadota bacterium]
MQKDPVVSETLRAESLDLPFKVRIENRSLEPATGLPAWQRSDSGERYSSRLSLFERHRKHLLKVECQGSGTFEISDDCIAVDWLGGTNYPHYLQTLGLSVFLEKHGVPCVHGNTLDVGNNNAITLIAPSRGGKSTLSAALVQLGCTLLSDDMTAVHFPVDAEKDSLNSDESHGGAFPRVYPSNASLRLWPDAAAEFAGCVSGMPRVHQQFAKRTVRVCAVTPSTHQHVAVHNQARDQRPRALKALFFLDRIDEPTTVHVNRLSDRDAFIQLVKQGQLADAFTLLSPATTRAKTLANILSQVPAYRVRFTSGFQYLEKVCNTILDRINDPIAA